MKKMFLILMILIISVGGFSENEYPETILAVKDFFTFVPGKETLKLVEFEDRGSKWLMYSISTASPPDIGYGSNLDGTFDIATFILKKGDKTFEEVFFKTKKAVAFILQLQNYIKKKEPKKYLPILRKSNLIYLAPNPDIRNKKKHTDKEILKIVKENHEILTSPILGITFNQYEQEEESIKKTMLKIECQEAPTLGVVFFTIDIDKNSLMEITIRPPSPPEDF